MVKVLDGDTKYREQIGRFDELAFSKMDMIGSPVDPKCALNRIDDPDGPAAVRQKEVHLPFHESSAFRRNHFKSQIGSAFEKLSLLTSQRIMEQKRHIRDAPFPFA